MKEVGIGIIGLGTVGGATVETLRTYAHYDHTPLDVLYKLHAVCARTVASAQRVGVESLYHKNWRDVVAHPQVDIVVELMGGTTEAREVVLTALQAGKDVVTANKALLALHGPELFAAARHHGCALRFEAAVAGGIPIVHTLEHSLVAHPIRQIVGILNGTTNYILSRMSHEQLSYADALKAAQDLGYAEADPTADVEGHDAAAKIALLASLATGQFFGVNQVTCQGITQVTSVDIEVAKCLGATIKLVAQAQIEPNSVDAHAQVRLQVAPCMLSNHQSLSRIDGATNAVSVLSEGLGETVYIGAGAGAFPTASAVVADILALVSALNRQQRPGEALVRATSCVQVGEAQDARQCKAHYLLRAELSDARCADSGVESRLSGLPQVQATAMLNADDKLKYQQLIVQSEPLTAGEVSSLASALCELAGTQDISIYQLMDHELLLKG